MVTNTESLSLPFHLLVLRYCRLSHHTAPSPSSLLRESGTASSPEHQAHGSSKPLGSLSSWSISLVSSLGLLNLNSHLLGALLQLVKCHPLTQDAKSPFRRCKQENLPPHFGQAFHTWNKAAVESWGWGGAKGKKDVSWKSLVI